MKQEGFYLKISKNANKYDLSVSLKIYFYAQYKQERFYNK
jgi:hypothetical protein